jgi:hypothetical protein
MPVDASPSREPRLRTACQQQLAALAESMEGLRMAIVASADGFPLASIGLESQEGRRFSAQAAALDALAQRMVGELALGRQESALIESDVGLVLCRQVANDITPMLLLVVTGQNSNPGYALWAVKKAARALSESLSAPASGAPTTSERER